MNIAEILKDCPRGTKLYSPICGECEIIDVWQDSIEVTTPTTENFFFNWNGTYCTLGEVLLFPSKDNRDWRMFQKLFKNGYKWNEETKALEKLIVPKFKVGDRIKNKYTCEVATIAQVREFDYIATIGDTETAIKRTFENHWELTPNKFDISTLKPFDEVLVRLNNDNVWCCAFSSHINDGLQRYCYKYVTTAGKSYPQMIPYEGNEHLLGTTKDCDEFYKTW